MKSPTNELQPYSYLTICLKPWITENMEGAELQFCSSEQNRRCRTTKFNRNKSNIFEDIFGWFVHQMNSLQEVLKLKQNFQKKIK